MNKLKHNNFDDLVERMEESEDLVECKECFDLFPKSEGIKIELGYLCPHCHCSNTKVEPDFEVADDDVFKLDFPELEKLEFENDLLGSEETPVEVEPQDEEEKEEAEEVLLTEAKFVLTYTMDSLYRAIYNGTLVIEGGDRSDENGWYSVDYTILENTNPRYDGEYVMVELLADQDGDEFEGDVYETFEDLQEVADYLEGEGYAHITDLVTEDIEDSEEVECQVCYEIVDRDDCARTDGGYFICNRCVERNKKESLVEDTVECEQELEGTDNAVKDCEVAKVVAHSEDEQPLTESSLVKGSYEISSTEHLEWGWEKGESYYVEKNYRPSEKEDIWQTEFRRNYATEVEARRAFARYKSQAVKGLKEGLNNKEFEEYTQLCKEIGIKGTKDLEAFLNEVGLKPGCPAQDVLQALRDWRTELGPDFKITNEAFRVPEIDANPDAFFTLPKMTVAKIKESLDKYGDISFDLAEPIEESDEDGWRGASEFIVIDLGDGSYEGYYNWMDQEGEVFERAADEYYTDFEELLYAIDDVYVDIIDLEEYIESQLAEDLEETRETLSESQAQEIGSEYNRLSKKFKIDFEDLVYGEKGFMKTKYPDGFPDFAGDVIYSKKYWNELVEFAKEKGIDLK